MRVLTVGNMYPPHHLGGYELLWQGANRRARERGHDVTVLTTDHREPGADAAEDEEGVHRTLRWYWSDHRFPKRTLRQRLELERHNHSELARLVEAVEPDVVAWWAMGGMSLSLIEALRRLGVPSVHVVIDDWLVYGPRVDVWTRAWSGPLRPFAGLAERRAGVPTRIAPVAPGEPVLFCSRFTLESARRAGAETGDARVCPPGVDERFLAAAAPADWDWRLRYVGRIDERKGLDTAVAALAHLPAQATLTVVGAGDDVHEASLLAQASAAGLEGRVRFLGPSRPAELPAVYAEADAVVFPVRWEEPWGLVPLEAMGVGRPVIATGRGGSGEYLRDGANALLFEAGDAEGLAAAVRRLADDPALRERLREEGLRTAAAHTATAWGDEVTDAYESAAVGSGE